MARLAGNHNSKSEDEYGSSLPPWQPGQSGGSSAPATISLADAIKLVIDGRLDAMAVYAQLPLQLVTLLDEAARLSGGSDFSSLAADRRRMIFVALHQSAQQAPRSPQTVPAPAARPSAAPATTRKWWQFWRR